MQTKAPYDLFKVHIEDDIFEDDMPGANAVLLRRFLKDDYDR